MEEMNYFGFENGDEYEIADKKARERIDELSSNLSNNSFGKLSGSANLFKPQLINTWQSNCVIDSNDKITITSTGTSGVAYARIGTLELKANTEYTFNILEKSGDFINIQLFKDDTTIVKIINDSTTFTPTEDMNVTVYGYVTIGSGKNCNFKLMVSTDGIHTEYEPYIMSNKQLTENVDDLKNDLYYHIGIGLSLNAESNPSLYNRVVYTKNGKTFYIKKTQTNQFFFIIGRGFDNEDLYCTLVATNTTNGSVVKNLGNKDITVTNNEDDITITFERGYNTVNVISPNQFTTFN